MKTLKNSISEETKRNYVREHRRANYKASMKLEGMTPAKEGVAFYKTKAQLVAKYKNISHKVC